mmetsp:Transcript_52964/g.138897  ORF Transcript_52964/g.138897 Transcript_52964/m.138897 type:complete len:715 (+) Transcript_52964:2-2146(+)
MRQVSGTSGFSNDLLDKPPGNAKWNSERRPSRSQVFADVEEMKEKVRLTLHKPSSTVSDFYKHEGCCQAIARNPRFETVCLCVVAANAFWIAIDTDYNDQEVLSNADVSFQVMQNLFCGFFVFEWAVRFFAFQRKCYGVRDPWFVLDSILVPIMVFDTWVVCVVALVANYDFAAVADSDSSILRLLRLLRLFRMARVARLLRATPELLTLIKAMAAALRSVFFTLCLLIVVQYVFAVGFTQVTAGTHIGIKHFSKVWESMYTLLLRGTLLCNVSPLMDELRAESAIATVMFLVFILIAAITVMNMLVGVLCEVVGTVAATEREEMAVDLVRGRLEDIVKTLDTNNNSVISKSEFAGLLENSEAIQALQDVGVDPVGLIDYADIIFENEIGDECDKELTFADFMEVVLELRGSETATVKDIVNLRKYIRKSAQQTGEQMERLENMLQTLVSQRAKPSRSCSTSRVTTPQPTCSKGHDAYHSEPSFRDAARQHESPTLSAQQQQQQQQKQHQQQKQQQPLRSITHVLSTPTTSARLDIEKMTASLEADLAAIFKSIQFRMHQLSQAVPHHEPEASKAQLREVPAADDGSNRSSGSTESMEPGMSGKQSESDIVGVRTPQVEANLLSSAASPRGGIPRYPCGVSEAAACAPSGAEHSAGSHGTPGMLRAGRPGATTHSGDDSSNSCHTRIDHCRPDEFFGVGVAPGQEAARYIRQVS